MKKLVKLISGLRKLSKRKRIVVITRAEKPVVYCDGNRVDEVEVSLIPNPIDTSCAGDAFVGKLFM
jgi:sugar/nucleoside kinase (ribokinase family)